MFIDKGPDVARPFKRASLFAMAAVGLVVVLGEVAIHYTVRSTEHDPELLLLAADQVTRSEQVAKAALDVSRLRTAVDAGGAGNDQATQVARRELRAALAAWTAGHARLVEGDDDLQLPVDHGAQITALLDDAGALLQTALKSARAVMSASAGGDAGAMTSLLRAQREYAVMASRITNAFEAQAHTGRVTALKVAFAQCMLVLAVIVAVLLRVVKPAVRRGRRDHDELAARERADAFRASRAYDGHAT